MRRPVLVRLREKLFPLTLIVFPRVTSRRRIDPFSRAFGAERGRPIDRHYIEGFLGDHRDDIRGAVLEVEQPTYTHMFGHSITQSDVLHVADPHPPTTIVSDLQVGTDLPSEAYDCVILTQTLFLIENLDAAVRTVFRILRPGGVALVTVPGISQIARDARNHWADHWRFTSVSARKLFARTFGEDAVFVSSYGNVLVASAFLYGLASHELTPEELDYNDPDFEMVICIRAEKRVKEAWLSAPRAEEPVTDSFWLRGGALPADSTIDRVVLQVGPQPPEKARLGVTVPVAARVQHPEKGICGFELLVRPTVLPQVDPVEVTGTVELANGRALQIPPLELQVARTESGRVRPTPTTPIVRRPASTPTRLAAFTHDMERGGAQLYLYALLEGLVAKGYSATLFSQRSGPLRDDLQALGVEVNEVGPYPIDHESYESFLERMLDEVAEFDLVLANTILTFCAVDLAGRAGLPSLWTVHESYPLDVIWPFFYGTPPDVHVRARAREAFGGASHVLFPSDATRAQHLAYVDASRASTMYLGTDVGRISAATSRGDRAAGRRAEGLDGGPLIVCIGQINASKGQSLVLRALDRLRPTRPNLKAAFVGAVEDDYLEALEKFAMERGISHRVKFVPPTPDVDRWYAAADLLVSASDYEAIPLTVFEAMAWRVPILATNVFGVAEAIEDGVTGFLCEARDVPALAEGIDRVLSMPRDKLDAVLDAAAREVAARFQSERYVTGVERIVRYLLADPDAGPPGDDLA